MLLWDSGLSTSMANLIQHDLALLITENVNKQAVGPVLPSIHGCR